MSQLAAAQETVDPTAILAQLQSQLPPCAVGSPQPPFYSDADISKAQLHARRDSKVNRMCDKRTDLRVATARPDTTSY